MVKVRGLGEHPSLATGVKGRGVDFVVPEGPLFGLLERAALAHPERVCVDFLGRTTNYGEIWRQVEALAAWLLRHGFGSGQRVGICLPNCPQAVVAYYGILRAGGVVVNLSPLQTAEELAAQVADSGTKMVICPNLNKILPKVYPLLLGKKLKRLMVVNFAEALPWPQSWLFRVFKFKEISPVPAHEGLVWMEEVLAGRSKPREVKINPAKDLALLQFTGGTTGVPKAAMLTHRNLMANTEQVRIWLGETAPEGERFLTILPLFHVFAMTACMNLGIAVGATLVLVPAFQLSQLLGIIRRTKPTIFPAVPSLFGAIANHFAAHPAQVAASGMGGIRWCISGGAPLPADIKARFEKLSGCVIVEGYGLTEASPVVSCTPPMRQVAGSVGQPLPGTAIEIRDLKKPAKILGAGKTGEIVAKGPQVMQGYWGKPKETAKVLQKGWLRTGDVGHLDVQGFLHLTNRLKEIILVSGYNVYPRAIEEVVYRHPKVAEVTVIGVPDADKGERPKIFVAAKAGEVVSEAEILEFVKDKLNPLQRPVAVEVRASLPKTPMGKLDRKVLVAEERARRG